MIRSGIPYGPRPRPAGIRAADHLDSRGGEPGRRKDTARYSVECRASNIWTGAPCRSPAYRGRGRSAISRPAYSWIQSEANTSTRLDPRVTESSQGKHLRDASTRKRPAARVRPAADSAG